MVWLNEETGEWEFNVGQEDPFKETLPQVEDFKGSEYRQLTTNCCYTCDNGGYNFDNVYECDLYPESITPLGICKYYTK